MPDVTGSDFVATTRHDTYPAIDPTKADLTGKVVLIAGASRGIGRATAVAFAKARASGIVLLARGDTSATRGLVEAAERPGAGLKILSVSADTTDPEQVAAAVAQIKTTFGRLDIVVNNAGASDSAMTLLADGDPHDWWRVWEVNIRGPYNVTRATLPLLLESGGDRTYINVSSQVAHWTNPTWSGYQLSKFALLRFTEQTASEYGPQGVIAIGLHPCVTPTDLNANLPADIQKLITDTPETASDTIVWLVKERRAWLNGRYFSGNWDVEEALARRDEIIAGDLLKLRMVVQ